MITISTLEQIENSKGQLYGIQHGDKVLYLGRINENQNIDYTAGFVLHQGQLQVTKEQVLKGNSTKYYKKYSLTVNNQPVTIVKESIANNILSEYVVIELILPANGQRLIGYKYDNKIFDADQTKQLIQQVSKSHLLHIVSIKQMINQSEFIMKPFKYVITLISHSKPPLENMFSSINSPSTNKSIKFITKMQQAQVTDQLLSKSIKNVYQQKQIHNNFNFLNDLLVQIPKKMWSPHVYLSTPPLFLHQRYMIKGNYQFYHYHDQLFNDNGWGCAYRAFQSLLSWFNIQGYTKIDIPSITNIQKTLFQIDRTRNLIDTKDWIGANEVGWLINKLTGVESKIIFLQDGESIMEKVDLFKQHFEINGTPIMYGGGQYAYTILGINYSWKLNECQFLILDPHYTLEDKPKSVVEKEGVSWKDKSKLFKKGTYYNFCLPQVSQSKKQPNI